MKNYNRLFVKNKIYFETVIYKITNKYKLFVTDCIKDDNEITVSLHGESEPNWEFELFSKTDSYPLTFRLRWTIYDEVV